MNGLWRLGAARDWAEQAVRKKNPVIGAAVPRGEAMRKFGLVLSAAVAASLATASPAPAGSVPNPTVSGPNASPDVPGTPTHNYPFFASNHDLPTHGYVEEEFYFQGTANRYNTPSLTTGTVIDGDHPYLTRMLVRRPADRKRFNGTVLVEGLRWLRRSRVRRATVAAGAP